MKASKRKLVACGLALAAFALSGCELQNGGVNIFSKTGQPMKSGALPALSGVQIDRLSSEVLAYLKAQYSPEQLYQSQMQYQQVLMQAWGATQGGVGQYVPTPVWSKLAFSDVYNPLFVRQVLPSVMMLKKVASNVKGLGADELRVELEKQVAAGKAPDLLYSADFIDFFRQFRLSQLIQKGELSQEQMREINANLQKEVNAVSSLYYIPGWSAEELNEYAQMPFRTVAFPVVSSGVYDKKRGEFIKSYRRSKQEVAPQQGGLPIGPQQPGADSEKGQGTK